MTVEPRSPSEKELLQDLCRKHNVKPESVEELLRVEKEYQLREKRHGIYEKLREVIFATAGVQGNNGRTKHVGENE
jgi:hypothetical protein